MPSWDEIAAWLTALANSAGFMSGQGPRAEAAVKTTQTLAMLATCEAAEARERAQSRKDFLEILDKTRVAPRARHIVTVQIDAVSAIEAEQKVAAALRDGETVGNPYTAQTGWVKWV